MDKKENIMSDKKDQNFNVDDFLDSSDDEVVVKKEKKQKKNKNSEFLKLSKRYEELKNEMKELKPLLQEEMTKIGVGNHFQDPETKAVYEIVEPTGTFISFDKVSYNRTRLGDEKKGSLSFKKAEEMGYDLK